MIRGKVWYNSSMADEQKFDTERARVRRNEILDPLAEVVKDLRENVVQYYWEKVPKTKEEDFRMRTYMKERLQRASRVIESLKGLLSDVD